MKIICFCSYYLELDKSSYLKDISDDFVLEVVDVRNVFTAKYHTITTFDAMKSSDNIKLIKLNTLNELVDYLSKNKSSLFLRNFTDRWQDWVFHILFKFLDLTVIEYIQSSNITNFQYIDSSESFVKKLLKKIKKGPQNIINFFLFSIFQVLNKLGFIVKTDTVFLTSKSDLFALMKYNRINDFEFINDQLYDDYLTQKPKISDDYIVFLAQNFPYATYDLKSEAEKKIDTQEYSKQLQKFLISMKNHYKNKEIVICTHPKYNISNKERDFGNFKVVQGESQKYIEKAYCVLGHFSSAINYAVLLKKSIILLDTPVFKNNHWVNTSMNHYFDLLKVQKVNMDQAVVSKIELEINNEQYEGFIKKFISFSYPVYYSSSVIFKNYIFIKYGR